MSWFLHSTTENSGGYTSITLISIEMVQPDDGVSPAAEIANSPGAQRARVARYS
jgi:hypothetical protein